MWIVPTISLACLACVPTRSPSQVSERTMQTPDDAFAKRAPGRVMVHLFEWRWEDISRECEQVLGPNGFYSVQISPPNEHRRLRSEPWWQRYQPVSYRLESRSGSRAAFVDMVQRCAKVGVGITADAVINHMAAGTTGDKVKGQGLAGSTYSKYEYPGLYQKNQFNMCSGESARSISTYQNAFEVQNCELVGLADLKTDSAVVQNRISSYLEELAGIGVHGFRIDAAKHMPAGDIASILGRAPKLPNTFLEVIGSASEPISPFQYSHIARVTEFRYSNELGEAVRAGTITRFLSTEPSGGWLPSDKALVFVDNHDNQRGHGSGGRPLTHREPELYSIAQIIMLALPYGQPALMSSYEFADGDQGPPADDDGNTLSVGSEASQQGCQNGWVCEHRHPAVLGMVAFRNTTASENLTNIVTEGQGFMSFSRGNKGWVAINRNANGKSIARSFATGLPQGRYCDAVTGGLALQDQTSRCRGQILEVDSQGLVTLSLKDTSAVAIHVGARLPEP